MFEDFASFFVILSDHIDSLAILSIVDFAAAASSQDDSIGAYLCITQIGLRNLWVLKLVLDSPFSLVKLWPHTKFQLPRWCISDLTLLYPPSPRQR